MGSNKAFLLLGLSLAIVLLISSEVAARELAEAQTTTTNKNTESATVDGRSGYKGYGGGGYHNGGGGYHNGGGQDAAGCNHYCRYRCCRYRCCNYAGEVVDAEITEVKPHN